MVSDAGTADGGRQGGVVRHGRARLCEHSVLLSSVVRGGRVGVGGVLFWVDIATEAEGTGTRRSDAVGLRDGRGGEWLGISETGGGLNMAYGYLIVMW